MLIENSQINDVKVMILNKFFSAVFIFLGVLAFSQDSISYKRLNQYPKDQLKTDEYGKKYYYDARQQAKIYEINGELVIVLNELEMRARPKFNNELDRNYYFFINKKLQRVYPLFLEALGKYSELHTAVEGMESDAKRKYTREQQKALANEYESQLRDLTTTEGKVFAKLMYRATNKSVYEIIKELRGGWSAFWWNVKGNVADVDIKEPYDPHKYRTDEFLESLLQSSWSIGALEPYPGYKDFKINK